MLLSWNVNGIRALAKKKLVNEQDFFEWLEKVSPDFLCLQETKAHPDQVTEELLNPPGYKGYWSAAERKGYSGVVTFAKEEPINVTTELGSKKLDNEGRHVILEYSNFVLANSYFPNGKKNAERLQYKLDYYDKFLEVMENYRKNGKSVIFCGDVNTAHKPIDLTHPKANEAISGFLPIERAWLDKIIDMGYIDSLRHFYPDKPEKYTWWSMRNIGARDRNVGWRLDYFFVSSNLLEKVTKAYILTEVIGSDHCPVGLNINL